MRYAVVLVTAAAVSGCNGNGSAPTAPSSAVPAPVIRALTVDRTQVDAGSEVALAAVLDNPALYGSIRFVWSVAPPGGTLTSNGSTARWRAPRTDPVPALYVFSVAVATAATSATASLAASVSNATAATSPAVTVNDAQRETEAHADAFLSDQAAAGAAPEFCVRNFAEQCGEGRSAAAGDVAALRARYSSGSTSYSMQLFERSTEWPNCTGADGSAICAWVLYAVDTVWTRRSDGGREQKRGYQVFNAVYARNRWSLCSTRFSETLNGLR